MQESVAGPLAHNVALTTTAFASGAIASLSLMAIPAIRMAPQSLATQQWWTLFRLGKAMLPPLAVVGSCLLGSLAYSHAGPARRWYIAAAAFAVGIVPYTLAFMGHVNHALMLKATSAVASAAKDNSLFLIDRWSLLSAGRAVLLLASSACAITAGFY